MQSDEKRQDIHAVRRGTSIQQTQISKGLCEDTHVEEGGCRNLAAELSPAELSPAELSRLSLKQLPGMLVDVGIEAFACGSKRFHLLDVVGASGLIGVAKGSAAVEFHGDERGATFKRFHA